MASDIPSTEPPSRSTSDPALLIAWRRFIDYDEASDAQKVEHTKIRRRVIYLGLSASVLAVMIGYLSTHTYNTANVIDVALTWILQHLGSNDPVAATKDLYTMLTTVVRVLLFAVPIALTYILGFASTFAPSLGWVSYRIGAELIRREIYLYRMSAGDYFGKSVDDQRKLLLESVGKADRRVQEIGAPDPYLNNARSDVDIAQHIDQKKTQPKDNGFNPMTLDEYIQLHVNPQIEWYINKSHSDYHSLRQWRRNMLVAAATGSILTAIDATLGPLVAITTAGGTAMSMYMELKMHGHTYGLYHPTANTLQLKLAAWNIADSAQQSDPAKIAALVKDIEDTFQAERDQWMQQAIQASNSFEQSLQRNVSQHPLTPGAPQAAPTTPPSAEVRTVQTNQLQVTTDPSTDGKQVTLTQSVSQTTVPVAPPPAPAPSTSSPSPSTGSTAVQAPDAPVPASPAAASTPESPKPTPPPTSPASDGAG
ncbi:MAG TPA: SLATT domain-containing protein [Aggregatilineales bacterium]|nr:SLATT domain-containing protein [Aggregatilineales bacterium]